MGQIPSVRGPNEPEFNPSRSDNVTVKTKLPDTLGRPVEVNVSKALHALGWFAGKGVKSYLEEVVKVLGKCHVYF